MEVAILVVCVIGLAAAVNGQISQLSGAIRQDIFGDGQTPGFLAWIGALIVIGGVFRALNLPEAGRTMIVLLMIAYLLGNKQMLAQLQAAIASSGILPAPGTVSLAGVGPASPGLPLMASGIPGTTPTAPGGVQPLLAPVGPAGWPPTFTGLKIGGGY
jgi:hypothetical protein